MPTSTVYISPYLPTTDKWLVLSASVTHWLHKLMRPWEITDTCTCVQMHLHMHTQAHLSNFLTCTALWSRSRAAESPVSPSTAQQGMHTIHSNLRLTNNHSTIDLYTDIQHNMYIVEVCRWNNQEWIIWHTNKSLPDSWWSISLVAGCEYLSALQVQTWTN